MTELTLNRRQYLELEKLGLGVFQPLTLKGLYPSKGEPYDVRLVDGGVFDNQGLVSLLAADWKNHPMWLDVYSYRSDSTGLAEALTFCTLFHLDPPSTTLVSHVPILSSFIQLDVLLTSYSEVGVASSCAVGSVFR